MSRRIGGGVWQTFFGPGSMVAHASPASSPRPPSHGRPLRLSMVATGRTRRTQTQDVVCPRPCQWERTDTRPDFGTINPPRAARTPGGRPDGRTDRAPRPARPGTGPPGEVAGVHRSRARRPAGRATPLGIILGMARGWRWLDLRGVHAAAGDTRRQAPGHRRRHQRRTDGRTRTRGAALRCSALRSSIMRPFRRVRRIKQC